VRRIESREFVDDEQRPAQPRLLLARLVGVRVIHERPDLGGVKRATNESPGAIAFAIRVRGR
jgi:hypothetical protein